MIDQVLRGGHRLAELIRHEVRQALERMLLCPEEWSIDLVRYRIEKNFVIVRECVSKDLKGLAGELKNVRVDDNAAETRAATKSALDNISFGVVRAYQKSHIVSTSHPAMVLAGHVCRVRRYADARVKKKST
jgi:hypothetical protein